MQRPASAGKNSAGDAAVAATRLHRGPLRRRPRHFGGVQASARRVPLAAATAAKVAT